MQERAHSPSSHKSPLALREAPTALVLRWRRRRAGELIEIESVEVEAEVPAEENEPVETIEKPDKPLAPAFEEDEPSVDSFSTFASDEQRAIAAKPNGKPSGRAQLALTEGKRQLTLKAWSFENGRRRYSGLPNDALKTRVLRGGVSIASIAAVLQAPFDPALARKGWNAYAASGSRCLGFLGICPSQTGERPQ